MSMTEKLESIEMDIEEFCLDIDSMVEVIDKYMMEHGFSIEEYELWKHRKERVETVIADFREVDLFETDEVNH